MDKYPAFSREEQTLIKSVFSLKDILAAMRDLHPSAFQGLPTIDIYDLMTEFIDLMIHIRTDQDISNKGMFGRRNPQIKEDVRPYSMDNPGSLVTVRSKDPIALFHPQEYHLLNGVRIALTKAKLAMKEGNSFPSISIEEVAKKSLSEYKYKLISDLTFFGPESTGSKGRDKTTGRYIRRPRVLYKLVRR